MSTDPAVMNLIRELEQVRRDRDQMADERNYLLDRLERDYVSRDRLRPLSSWSRKFAEDDGRLVCNHGDCAPCSLSGHTTVPLYEIVDPA